MTSLKFIFSVLCLIMSISLVSGQNHTITTGPKKNTYYYNGVPIPMSHLKDYLSSNDDALRHFRRATANNVTSCILAAAGGAMIGWPLGTWIGGGDPNWYLALGGAGLIGLSIPFAIGHNRQLNKAVEAYNNGLVSDLSTPYDFSLSFSTTPGGVGLILTF